MSNDFTYLSRLLNIIVNMLIDELDTLGGMKLNSEAVDFCLLEVGVVIGKGESPNIAAN